MSYYASITDDDFVIEADRIPGLLDFVNSTIGKPTESGFMAAGEPHEPYTDLDTLFRDWGFEIGWSDSPYYHGEHAGDPDHHVVTISFEGGSLRDEKDLFVAIAPWVADGSSIDWHGEDDCLFSWRFHDGTLDEVYGSVRWYKPLAIDDALFAEIVDLGQPESWAHACDDLPDVTAHRLDVVSHVLGVDPGDDEGREAVGDVDLRAIPLDSLLARALTTLWYPDVDALASAVHGVVDGDLLLFVGTEGDGDWIDGALLGGDGSGEAHKAFLAMANGERAPRAGAGAGADA